jgi:hypothetical protein
MRNGYAVVWFGSTSDPQGEVSACSATPVEATTWGSVKALFVDGVSGP